MPTATADLARRLERVAADYLVTRYSGPGNPMGTQFLRDSDLIATKVPYVPHNRFMNGVHGLEHAGQLPAVLSFYGATGQPCWIDVLPDASTALTNALIDAHFRPDSYGATLYAAPLPQPGAPPTGLIHVEHYDGVDISVADDAGLDVFLDTLNVGFGSPPDVLPALRANQHFWPGIATWRLLLARVDGAPAGAAVLAVHERCAYLAVASVLPAFQRRGVHRRLIDTRIDHARGSGCTLITGQAEWGSVSQCNQQRAGLAICHAKTVWTNHRSAV